MKTVAVYFREPKFLDRPFDDPRHRLGYEELADVCVGFGMRFAIVRDPTTYTGENRFTGGWWRSEGAFQETSEEIAADTIFNKGEIFPGDARNLINARRLDLLFRNKWETYKAYPELSPKTVFADSASQARDVLEAIPGEFVVAKPVAAWGGREVSIGSRRDVLAAVREYPIVLQEFIDTSGGIPGVTSGAHDLRILNVNGQWVIGLLRRPPEGSLVANVARGGTLEVVEDIPAGALAIAKRVDERCRTYGKRLYSVDVARSADGRWLLIECNPQPGILASAKVGNAHARRTHEAMARMFRD